MNALARMRWRFADPEAERHFKAYYVDSYIPMMQVFLLIGCFIFFVFYLWDEMVSPQQAHIGKTIRFAIVCPLIALVAALLSWRRLRPVVEAVVCIAPLAALIGVVVIFDRFDAYAHSAAAILLLEMFCFVTLRVRFVYFVALVVATLVVYDVGHLLAATSSPTLFLINNMFVVSASTLGLFATFVQERLHRNQYLNRQLLDTARASAEQADRAKGRFIATASHDLRQPVHALGLYVHALRGHAVDAAVGHIHRQIAAALRTLEDMFESLLDLSRLTGGGVKAAATPVALGPVFEELRLLFEHTARDRGLQLRVRPCAIQVLSDPLLLQQMLQKLVGNALRYTERGGVLLACRRAGAAARIEVWDTGCGIPADKLGAVFEEFVRLQQGPRPADGGLGIGLAIVKESARILGHRLTVRSRVGRGSCFAIELGRVALPAAAAAPAPAPHAAGPAPPVGPLDHFVVVIDDDLQVLESTGLLLRAWGCAVILAGDAGAACAQLAEHDRTPDLIITDFELEHENGLQAVAQVRRAAGAQVPAVVVTGRMTVDVGEQIAAAGLGWHAKPLSPERLRAIVAAAPATEPEAAETLSAAAPRQARPA